MGLDMYLYAEKYRFDRDNEAANDAKLSEVFPEFGEFKVKTARAEVAYWRKSNQVHSWFVTNVQKGVDDCGDYYVERDQLKELCTLCKNALNKKDSTLLEPKEGFFFGSTDIDEWYWEDLRNTIKMLKKALKLDKSLSFYYHSSW